MMCRSRFACTLLLAAMNVNAAWSQPCGALQDLQTLGGASAEAYGVSSDGGVVVGLARTAANQTIAFRWTAADGMQGLGTLDGGPASAASGVSADGSVVVGLAYDSAFLGRAFRWTQAGGMQDLGTLGQDQAVAQGVSANGVVVVGYVHDIQENTTTAFRWTSASGMQAMGTLGGASSAAFGVSGDGAVVVGSAENIDGQNHAFRWTAAGGMQDLGTLGGTASEAYGVSADGSTVVGYAYNDANRQRAFLWPAANGMQDLGDLGGADSFAYGISADGAVVVGEAVTAAGESHAFRWTQASGIQDLGTLGGSSSGAKGVSADGGVIVGSAQNAAGQSRAFRWGADTDGDGIADDWECNGIPYTDPSGQSHRYILPGANWLRKDVYVEVDAMVGRAPLPLVDAALAAQLTAAGLTPTNTVLDLVVKAFLVAPVPPPIGVQGGLGHVALHVVLDETDLPLRPYPGAFAEFQQDKNGATFGFGTDAERCDSRGWPAIRGAKREVYRYCIFADSYGTTSSSGLAEKPGNDFMVTLGLWSVPGGTMAQQIGTFMHELGHALGLGHGGDQDDDRFNYKPNYFSTMNYMWQSPKPWLQSGIGPGQWEDFFPNYSAAQLPDLNENSLNEIAGIQGGIPVIHVPYSLPLGTVNCDSGTTCSILQSAACIRYAPFDGPVDWDNDCHPDSPATSVLDINNIRGNAGPSPGDALTGFNDWINLQYDFRGAPGFADGVVITDAPVEIDLETDESLNSLPPPPGVCAADFNHDAILNSQDFFAFISAFFMNNADFNHDGATNSQDFFDFLADFFAGC